MYYIQDIHIKEYRPRDSYPFDPRRDPVYVLARPSLSNKFTAFLNGLFGFKFVPF